MPFLLSRPRFIFRLFVTNLACLGIFFFFIPITNAFSVSPALIDLEIQRGASKQGVISVTNTSRETKRYVLSIQNFEPQGEDGQQVFHPEVEATGLATWISSASSSVTLKPHETRNVAYSINVPANAPAGGHYAAVFFSEQSEAASADAIGVSARIGVLFLVTVPGAVPVDSQNTGGVRIESFVSKEGNLISHLPIYLETRLRNEGSTHIRPVGSIIIKNTWGRQAIYLPLNPSRNAILPHSVRRFETVWGSGSEDNSHGMLAELRQEWRSFAIGKYTIEVELLPELGDPLRAQTVVWVIPWMILSLVCIFLALGGGGYKLYRALKRS